MNFIVMDFEIVNYQFYSVCFFVLVMVKNS